MDRKLIQRIVAILERDLRQRILPELTTPASKLQIDYMTRLLQWISVQVGRYDEVAAAHDAQLQSLLATDEVAGLPAAAAPFGQQDAAPAEVGLLRAIGANAGEHPAPFDRYVELETRLARALDAEGGSGIGDVYNGGKLTAARSAITAICDEPTLTAYLQRRFASTDARATGIRPLPGGFGKDTVLFTIHGCGPCDGEAVIRKDFSVRAGPTPVTAEFPLLQALHRRDFAVAEPLWAEPDEAVLAGPFIVSRRVAGQSAVSDWQDSAELRRHYVDRFAETLAQLHGFTNHDIFGTADTSTLAAVNANMQLYYDHYRHRARAVNGRLEAAFAWLAANNPASADTVARLVHGDMGFHNILMENGKINAVLDWEFSHFGDPAEDIGYCWQFIEKLVDWDDFMAMYAGHGGTPVSDRSASYYRVWGDVRNAAMGVGALGTVELSDNADIRSPSAALAFGPLLEVQGLSGAAQWNRQYG